MKNRPLKPVSPRPGNSPKAAVVRTPVTSPKSSMQFAGKVAEALALHEGDNRSPKDRRDSMSASGGATGRHRRGSLANMHTINDVAQSDAQGQNPHSPAYSRDISRSASPAPENAGGPRKTRSPLISSKSVSPRRSPERGSPARRGSLTSDAMSPIARLGNQLQPLRCTLDISDPVKSPRIQSPAGKSKVPTPEMRTKAVNLVNKALLLASEFEIRENGHESRLSRLPPLVNQVSLEIERDVFTHVAEEIKAGKLPNYSATIRSITHSLRVLDEKTVDAGTLARLLLRRRLTGTAIAKDASCLLNPKELDAKHAIEDAKNTIITHEFNAEDPTIKCPACGLFGVHYERTRFENPFAEYVEGSVVNDEDIDKLCKCDGCGHSFWSNSAHLKTS